MGARYINTDLVVKARFSLVSLAQSLEDQNLVVVGEPTARGGVWRVCFESSLVRPTPARAAEKMLTAIESLDGNARQLWDRCFLREFDLGFECHRGDFASEFSLTNEVVRRTADVGASVRITIYRNFDHEKATEPE